MPQETTYNYIDNIGARLDAMLKAKNGDDVPFLIALYRHNQTKWIEYLDAAQKELEGFRVTGEPLAQAIRGLRLEYERLRQIERESAMGL